MQQAMSLVTLAAPFGGVRGRLMAALQQDRTGVCVWGGGGGGGLHGAKQRYWGAMFHSACKQRHEACKASEERREERYEVKYDEGEG